MNRRPVVVAEVRTIRHRLVAAEATEVHVETVEDTCRVAWDEVVADTGEAVVAAIAGKVPTMHRGHSVEVREVVVAAEVTAAQDPEATAEDQATTAADTTMDRLRRITRWAATRVDTTKDLHRDSSSTPDNRPTRLR